MNKGVKIALGITMTAGIGAIVYFMFVKKDSPIYLFKNGKDGEPKPSETGSDTASPSVTTTSSTAPISAPAVCEYPATPFKSKKDGNAFRDWVNDEYSSYARSIDLDRSGDYNNCFIRKAYSHKISGRTLGNIWSALLSSEPQTQDTDRNDFEYFVQRLKDLNIPYKIGSEGAVLVKVHSDRLDMANWYYQFAFTNNGEWAVAMWKDKPFESESKILASGLYNLDSAKAGTSLKIKSGNDWSGNSMKYWSQTANNNNLWTMQRVIQRYWNPQLSNDMTATLKAVQNF